MFELNILIGYKESISGFSTFEDVLVEFSYVLWRK